MTPSLGYPDRTVAPECTCAGDGSNPHHERCPKRECPDGCLCDSCVYGQALDHEFGERS